MTVHNRNKIFEEKKHLIDVTVKKHRTLVKSARLDIEDVRQELSVRLLEALDKYEPARCPNIDAYLTLQLRYCLLHLRECSKLFGVPYAPRKDFSVLSLDAPDLYGQEMQVPSYDKDTNIIWLENEIASLPDPQRAAIYRLLSGERISCNNKNLKAARKHIRSSLNQAELLYA